MNAKFPPEGTHRPKQVPEVALEWIEIGTIVAPQGLNGEVRIYPDSDFPERFEIPGQRWLLYPHTPEPQAIELVRGYYLNSKGLYVVQFAGVIGRSQAEALRGCRVLVPASDRPTLEAGEIYVQDLIGLQVFDQRTQELVGSVVSIIPAGNDLLEVQSQADQPTVLIPLVREIVPVMDLDNKRIEITPPPGLLP